MCLLSGWHLDGEANWTLRLCWCVCGVLLLQITSLRRVKDVVEEVTEGFECGLGCGDFLEWQEKDSIECYRVSEALPLLCGIGSDAALACL